MNELPLPRLLFLSAALPGPRFPGPTGSPWPPARWAALGSCGFPALSVLFAWGLPASDPFSPAAWEAEPPQGVLDITSLLGTSCEHVWVYLTHFWRVAELVQAEM